MILAVTSDIGTKRENNFRSTGHSQKAPLPGLVNGSVVFQLVVEWNLRDKGRFEQEVVFVETGLFGENKHSGLGRISGDAPLLCLFEIRKSGACNKRGYPAQEKEFVIILRVYDVYSKFNFRLGFITDAAYFK